LHTTNCVGTPITVPVAQGSQTALLQTAEQLKWAVGAATKEFPGQPGGHSWKNDVGRQTPTG
jgi:hypothetical protein